VTETLTESFCERCGTRYTFDPLPPPKRLGRLRMLSRGLKSYVLEDGSSFGDVMEHERSDDERRRANAQLDKFHDAFKFCMSCRQYTCSKCWNREAGRCLSCAPVATPEAAAPFIDPLPAEELPPLEVDELPEPTFAAAEVAADWAPGPSPEWPDPVTPIAETPVVEAAPEPVAVVETPTAAPAPSSADDDGVDLLARLGFGADEERRTTPVDRSLFGQSSAWTRRVDPTVADRAAAAHAAPQPTFERPAEGLPRPIAEPPTTAAESPTREVADVDLAVAESVVAEPVAADTREARVDEPVDAEPAAESDEIAAIVAADELASATSAELETDDLPLHAQPSTTPEPATSAMDAAAAPPAPAPAAKPAEPIWWIVAPEGQQPRTDTGVQPTWAQPAPTTTPTSTSTPTSATPATRPTPPLTNSPVWPTLSPAAMQPPAQAAPPQPPARVAPADAVWAASSRDVLNRPGSGAQACVACGLALSAAAKFCRRCGSPQH
jgi:hypothetical protein